MAVNSLGIGIHITVTGDYEAKLRNATRLTKGFADVQKDLAKKAEESRRVIVDQAIAFQVLALRFTQVARASSRLFTGFVGGMVNMIKGASDFQTQAGLLKVFFGSKAETLTGQLYLMSQATGIAIDDLTTVATRLGQAGVSAEQAARATEIVGKAFTTLPASEKARALIQMGRAFDRVQSFNTAFNVVLSKTEEKLFLAAQGAKRVEVGILALEKRFGSVTDVMGGTLNFQVQKMIGMFRLLNIRIVLPAIEPLRKALARINAQFAAMIGFGDANNNRFEKLSRIFQALISPFVKILEAIGELKLLPKAIDWLANHEDFVKSAGAFLLISSGLIAIAASALAATFAVGGLVRTMQASGLVGVGGGALKKMFMNYAGGRGAAGMDLFSGAKKVGGFLGGRGQDFMGRLTGTRMAGGGIFKSLNSATSFATRGGGMFQSMLPALENILSIVGNLAARFAGLAFIGIFVAAIMKEAFQPLKENLGEGIGHIVNLAKGLYQVFTTGKITLATLQDLENSGFGPLFKMMVTFGFFIKDFITGVFGGMEGLGDSISGFIDVLKFAWQTIGKAIFDLLQDFGLFQDGGSDAFLGLGFSLGNFVKLLLQGAMLINEWFIIPTVQGIQVIVGLVEIVIAAFKFLFGSISAGLGTLIGFWAKFESVTGAKKEDVASMTQLSATLLSYGSDVNAGALGTLAKGINNTMGGSTNYTFEAAQTQVMLDGNQVGQFFINYNLADDAKSNRAVP